LLFEQLCTVKCVLLTEEALKLGLLLMQVGQRLQSGKHPRNQSVPRSERLGVAIVVVAFEIEAAARSRRPQRHTRTEETINPPSSWASLDRRSSTYILLVGRSIHPRAGIVMISTVVAAASARRCVRQPRSPGRRKVF
jgi:hypothetical protein